MKNSRKKTILTVLALVLVVAVAIVGSVTAYWTAGLTSIPEKNSQVQITVGKAKELEAVFDVEVEKLKGDEINPFGDNDRLVPENRANLSATDGGVVPTEVLVVKAKIKIAGTNYTEHIQGSDLQKIKATLSFTGLAQIYFKVTGDLAQVLENVEINNPSYTVAKWTIKLKEPVDKNAYDAVINQQITLNIKVEKVG